MSLPYLEWCEKRGLPYDDEESKRLWKKWCDDEFNNRKPDPPPTRDSGRFIRTWMQDREDELRRRANRIRYRIIWPKQPLRVVHT